MEKCIKRFERHVNERFKIIVNEVDSKVDTVYIINLTLTDGSILICTHPDHQNDNHIATLSAHISITEENKDLVGNVTSVVSGCWLHGATYLNEDLGRCGVGTMLMLICECIALARNVKYITLDDSSDFPKFYEKLGYVKQNDDEVMVKILDENDWKVRADALSNNIDDLIKKGKCSGIWAKSKR